MGSINAGANSDNMGIPDLSGMMNMVGPMLGALSSTGGGSSSGGVEADIEAQVAKARKKGVLPTIKE